MSKPVKKWYGIESPCNAPFNNMYFTVRGTVSPCWKLPGYCDKWSAERSISDIWNGDKFQGYRDSLKQCVFKNRCKECEQEIENDVWPLAKAYEKYPVGKYPSIMELELSNQCNLECIMCSGDLSSGIRKNRDKLPPMIQAYDESFIEQLKEFIPHLTEMRFNGGEPFAQKIVLDICDVIAEINPGLKINIATNGTIYNKRVKHILANNNIHINISIDSLIKERYEYIRINGNFDKLMENTKIFSEYCKVNNRNLSVMVNPMVNNWEEMIEFAIFADNIGASLWYNTILYPENLAVWKLQSSDLEKVYTVLSADLQRIPPNMKNYPVAKHFVEHQVKNWWLDSFVRDAENDNTL